MNLRRVALADLGAIGYLPAADAIARCSTENSFKIIALKGLLQHQIDEVAATSKRASRTRHPEERGTLTTQLVELSDAAIRVMDLMDSLIKLSAISFWGIMTDSAQTQELIHAVEQAGSPAQLVAAVRTLAAAQIEAVPLDCCVGLQQPNSGSGGSGRADPYG